MSLGDFRGPAMIPFSLPPQSGEELAYIAKAIATGKISGDGDFTKLCNNWIEDRFLIPKVLLTSSGTHALDMSAILCSIVPGDEVILPSFTFSSTANAFVLRGARLKFVDIRPDTMNIDEKLIEAAITDKTKVIVVVHYAGVACEMDTILAIARKHGLLVVEDAAQAFMAYYKKKPLGAIADLGCYSFHETKNFSMGEGGAILVNKEEYAERAEIIREKGTNRSRYFRGQVDKYSWMDCGSSFLPSELNAAYLYPQLLIADHITQNRLSSWNYYVQQLADLSVCGFIEFPSVPEECMHNAHIFYVKTRNLDERARLISYLKRHGVSALFHYVPLHSSPAGEKYGEFVGNDCYTTIESERLLRLPLYYRMTISDLDRVCGLMKKFYLG